ncbi:BadF-type ATPase [Tenacibaculum sp. MAR_2009_124]|uniref:N-acetylglucosamine kinase n=1 Tax=Tenacibaculum sp. MAR_2009_124 TaxID=1250059 RepID=UPI00089764DF|nr:N-acetylglucosamine kinase [Tenacibaculum sp. MAR_2009_124]SEC43011.1 BadF-type ATPase [Tenacibaculum sp. MAR_2009_124]
MILVADGGSTKVDWVAIDNDKNEIFRTSTLGLNPNVVSSLELQSRLESSSELKQYKDSISEIYFYGAGLGTSSPIKILTEIFESFFKNTKKITVEEDILGAVYASAKNEKAIVCILGTGANSCYYDGETVECIAPSLGYIIMDEASGNYFGKRLVRDYFYKKMPDDIATVFNDEFDLTPDVIKFNLYKVDNPNKYLASFAKFMFNHQENAYIRKLVMNGFKKFFLFHVLNYNKSKDTPIYFIGSIAYYFGDLLREEAEKNDVQITGIIAKPIDNLIEYHKEILVS